MRLPVAGASTPVLDPVVPKLSTGSVSPAGESRQNDLCIDLNHAHHYYEGIFYNPTRKRIEPTEFRLICPNQPDAVRCEGNLLDFFPAAMQLLGQGYTILATVENENSKKIKSLTEEELYTALEHYSRRGYTEVVLQKPKVLHFWGTLEEVESKLTHHNANGYSVYAVVNRIKRQKLEQKLPASDADISGIRAAFVDLDEERDPSPLAERKKWKPDKTATNLGKLLDAPQPPSLIVKSSQNKYHGYWPITDLKVKDFVEVQWHLAHTFGGDRRVANPSRIMRVPGFLNTKYDPPELATLLEVNS